MLVYTRITRHLQLKASNLKKYIDKKYIYESNNGQTHQILATNNKIRDNTDAAPIVPIIPRKDVDPHTIEIQLDID